jgi:hypothetical protein
LFNVLHGARGGGSFALTCGSDGAIAKNVCGTLKNGYISMVFVSNARSSFETQPIVKLSVHQATASVVRISLSCKLSA